jgi:hypothetical protein
MILDIRREDKRFRNEWRQEFSAFKLSQLRMPASNIRAVKYGGKVELLTRHHNEAVSVYNEHNGRVQQKELQLK